jgi:hypothetical protein
MHIGEFLAVAAVGSKERFVELEQDDRARPQGELPAAMGHGRRPGAGIARQTIAVVIGLDHLAHLAPHGGESAVAATEHRGADMDGIHRGVKRHIGSRIELAGVGEMFEQLGKAQEALPIVQPLRQHVRRQRFPDDSHRSPGFAAKLAGSP